MPNYSNGKIYNIVCNLTGETYYGSTTQKISARMGTHRRNKDCCSKQIIERGDYHYGLVEDYKCDNSEQLRMRERYYVDNNDCVNKVIPIRTKEEGAAMKKVYQQEHNEEIAAYQKVYQQEHNEEISAYQKTWREEHKDEIAAKAKVSYEEHLAAKKKLYYETNKEKISAQRKAKRLLNKQAEK